MVDLVVFLTRYSPFFKFHSEGFINSQIDKAFWMEGETLMQIFERNLKATLQKTFLFHSFSFPSGSWYDRAYTARPKPTRKTQISVEQTAVQVLDQVKR